MSSAANETVTLAECDARQGRTLSLIYKCVGGVFVASLVIVGWVYAKTDDISANAKDITYIQRDVGVVQNDMKTVGEQIQRNQIALIKAINGLKTTEE